MEHRSNTDKGSGGIIIVKRRHRMPRKADSDGCGTRIARGGRQRARRAEARRGGKRRLHLFERRQLTDVYYSEGRRRRRHQSGRPSRHRLRPLLVRRARLSTRSTRSIRPSRSRLDHYADHFFAWVYDFNGDGWNDVLVGRLSRHAGLRLREPRPEGTERTGPSTQVFDSVGNESPQFTDIVGDERPELVCTRDGFFGFATVDLGPARSRPGRSTRSPTKLAPMPFGHGLGVGDVNGDGRMDLLMKDGWFEQPAAKRRRRPRWTFHPVDVHATPTAAPRCTPTTSTATATTT